jgi:hypothetical protein
MGLSYHSRERPTGLAQTAPFFGHSPPTCVNVRIPGSGESTPRKSAAVTTPAGWYPDPDGSGGPRRTGPSGKVIAGVIAAIVALVDGPLSDGITVGL